MLLVISPAKKLNENCFLKYDLSLSKPNCLNESKILVSTLKKYSPKALQKLMNVSQNIARLNYDRYSKWKTPFNKKNSYPAILLFEGDVYKGINANNFDKSDFNFAQKHLRILSGLYGILKPLDLIQPYRLEMGTSIKIKKFNNLYEFWGDKITDKINNDNKNKPLINLASNEYFKSINESYIKGEVINIIFKEKKGNNYKVIGILAKKARGIMSRYIIKNKIKDPERLKKFSLDSYRFNKTLSTEQDWVFTR